jgi:hypothetical protein
MLTETPQKLYATQGGYFAFALVPVIFEQERYILFSNFKYPVIADSYPVDVLAQIAYNMLRFPQ